MTQYQVLALTSFMPRFKSMDVIPFHRANPALEVFNRRVAEMDILAKPIEVSTCMPVVGHKWL
jgi:hypothetical protein